ncbi:MAG: MBL fold metallo-hydrolase [Planctomycetes bacterium]|nr:MBL fold metallo-hydrolase [Planctomycetota bacterium]
MRLTCLGAAREVTGSCHLLEVDGRRVLLDCGLFQGRPVDELRNRDGLPFDASKVDAVVLSHSHIDHSGRLPLLVRNGFTGPIHTHRASRELCTIMLKDAAFLAARDAEWDNRKRARKGLAPVDPIYTLADVEAALGQFRGLRYGRRVEVVPGVHVRLQDAGHILGSAIVEAWLEERGVSRKLVFSGDLGHDGAPILRNVTPVPDADLVMLESTYGDRLHRPLQATLDELREVLDRAWSDGGNVVIPAFAVGRTQELLYLFARHFHDWNLGRFEIFVDSPMAIQATRVYLKHEELYDGEASKLWKGQRRDLRGVLPNLHFTASAEQSMRINRIRSGAVIIAGSGMCNGGRVRHHFKHNLWRRECHVLISGFQARGTPGRALVDGAKHLRLWGETIRVAAAVHTLGGLSAHADQPNLVGWYRHFQGAPPVLLVHGENHAQEVLADELRQRAGATTVHIAAPGESIDLARLPNLSVSPPIDGD